MGERVFTAVLVTGLEQDDLIERLEGLPGTVVAFCGPGSLVEGVDADPDAPVCESCGRAITDETDVASDGRPFCARCERDVRLDEERIAAEMERESVRGICPPDF